MNKKNGKKKAVKQQHFEPKAKTACIHQKQASATKLALEEQRITRQR